MHTHMNTHTVQVSYTHNFLRRKSNKKKNCIKQARAKYTTLTAIYQNKEKNSNCSDNTLSVSHLDKWKIYTFK